MGVRTYKQRNNDKRTKVNMVDYSLIATHWFCMHLRPPHLPMTIILQKDICKVKNLLWFYSTKHN